jgi:hypothetical protein
MDAPAVQPELAAASQPMISVQNMAEADIFTLLSVNWMRCRKKQESSWRRLAGNI